MTAPFEQFSRTGPAHKERGITCAGCGSLTSLTPKPGEQDMEQRLSAAARVEGYRLVPGLGWVCANCYHAVPSTHIEGSIEALTIPGP